MVYNLNSDDYNGICMTQNKYPLINAIKKKLEQLKQKKSL